MGYMPGSELDTPPHSYRRGCCCGGCERETRERAASARQRSGVALYIEMLNARLDAIGAPQFGGDPACEACEGKGWYAYDSYAAICQCVTAWLKKQGIPF